jgi:glutaredoxin
MLDTHHISYELVDVIQAPEQEVIMYSRSGSHGVPQVAVENILIYDYGTEETLVQDIQKILSTGPVLSDDPVDLTSQFVFLGK